MSRPRFDAEDRREDFEAGWLDVLAMELRNVRWTFIIAAPFVAFVVLLLLKMAFDCAMGVCVP